MDFKILFLSSNLNYFKICVIKNEILSLVDEDIMSVTLEELHQRLTIMEKNFSLLFGNLLSPNNNDNSSYFNNQVNTIYSFT